MKVGGLDFLDVDLGTSFRRMMIADEDICSCECDVRRAFDVDLLHIAENLRVPIVEVAVQWEEIEGMLGGMRTCLNTEYKNCYFVFKRSSVID